VSRLKLLILDACVVIQLHELGRWQQVVDQCDIHLSEIVAQREVRFDDANGTRIDLEPESRFPFATLAKSAPLWGPIRDKYSLSLRVMKTAGLTTRGYEMSAWQDFLFRPLICLTRRPKVANLASR
jgi:hypothetical protein